MDVPFTAPPSHLDRPLGPAPARATREHYRALGLDFVPGTRTLRAAATSRGAKVYAAGR